MKKQFICFFWFVSWRSISIGVSLNIRPLHLEIHLPFGFIKIGMVTVGEDAPSNHNEIRWRQFGLGERYKQN